MNQTELRETLREWEALDVDTKVDLEMAMKHIPRLYARAILLWMRGYSMREAERKLGTRRDGHLVNDGLKALLVEVNRD